jgi:hypothetical protein
MFHQSPSLVSSIEVHINDVSSSFVLTKIRFIPHPRGRDIYVKFPAKHVGLRQTLLPRPATSVHPVTTSHLPI